MYKGPYALNVSTMVAFTTSPGVTIGPDGVVHQPNDVTCPDIEPAPGQISTCTQEWELTTGIVDIAAIEAAYGIFV